MTYDADMADRFDRLVAGHHFRWKLLDILPRVLPAGVQAGRLTPEGAQLLDPTGELQPGTPFCPPEGDAGTGMVATNSVAERTGNVSAGTSIFAMVVLERPLSQVYPEIDRLERDILAAGVELRETDDVLDEREQTLRLGADRSSTFLPPCPSARSFPPSPRPRPPRSATTSSVRSVSRTRSSSRPASTAPICTSRSKNRPPSPPPCLRTCSGGATRAASSTARRARRSRRCAICC